MTAGGTHFGWASPSIPKLFQDDSPVKISKDDASWIISIMLLGSIVGPIPAGFLANRIGRKLTLIFTAVPFIASWVIILLAETATVIFIGRFVAGMAYGATYAVAPMYLGEIASDRIRGALTTFKMTMLSGGTMISYCVGPYVPFRTLPYILMVIPITVLLSYFWIPETPYFYIMKHREDDAFKSLKYLRQSKDEDSLNIEFNNIKNLVEKNQQNKGSLKELVQTRGNRMAMLILLICGAGIHLNGGKVIKSYAEQIFQETGGVISPSESTMVIGSVELIMSVIASLTIDKLGRRPLLFTSLTGVITTNVVMGVYFFIKDFQGADVSSITWLPMVTLMFFVISDTMGVAALPHTLLGELFPTNVKALAACIITMFAAGIGFGVMKLYQVVSDNLGSYVSHWIFAACSILQFMSLFFMLPETKNLPLAEIQLILNEKRKR